MIGCYGVAVVLRLVDEEFRRSDRECGPLDRADWDEPNAL